MHFRFKIVLIPKAFKNIICLDSLGLSVGKPWPDLILYCGINKTISPGIKSSLTRIKISTSPKESQAFKTVYVCMCWPFYFQWLHKWNWMETYGEILVPVQMQGTAEEGLKPQLKQCVQLKKVVCLHLGVFLELKPKWVCPLMNRLSSVVSVDLTWFGHGHTITLLLN